MSASGVLALVAAMGLATIPTVSGAASHRLWVERRPPRGAVVADALPSVWAGLPRAAVSASQADAIALHAVGGGVVLHTSSDRAGAHSVWDVHVLLRGRLYDVKVSQRTGAVVRQKLSNEQPGRDGREPVGAGREEVPAPVVVAGIPFDEKLAAAPPGYIPYVKRAIAAVHGIALRWVEFHREDRGAYQMTVKIRLVQGGAKVKDVFGPRGQLLRQKRSTDS